MAADDKQKGNATGFSGLSTVVSEVEDNRPASKSAPEVTPPPRAPPRPEPPTLQPEEAQAASTAPHSSKAKGDGSSDVTTGKWMVGIGWGIGLLLIIFVNATKNEPTRSTTAPVAQAPTTAIPVYPPPSVSPRQPPSQVPSRNR